MERKKLENEIHKYGEQYLKEYFDKQKVFITNNIFKLFVVSSNNSCGIGKSRILKIFSCINKMMSDSEKDEIFWYHIDKSCEKILGEETFNTFLGGKSIDK